MIFLSLQAFSQAPTLALEGLCGKHAQKQFITIGDPLNVTLATNLPVNQYVNQNINIIGDIVFDKSFTFEHCAIKFENGKSFFVRNSRILTISSSDLFSCDKLWKGIILDNQARIDLNNCSIEDAYTVISTNENSILNMFSVLLNKNYIGIKNLNSKSPIFGLFAFNRFTCSSILRQSWSPAFPAGNWSQSGMDFQGCTVAFGNPANIANGPFSIPAISQFDNMETGIVANNESIISVRNCIFDTLRLNGLTIRESHLNFAGIQNGASLTQTIRRCGNGVNARNSQLDIRNTNFSNNTANAIRSIFNTNEQYINITSNLIQNRSTGVSNGIFLQRSSGQTLTTNNILQNNTINMSGTNPNSIAMEIVGSNNPTDNLMVGFNTVSINETPLNGNPAFGRNNHGIFYSNMNSSGYGNFVQNNITNTGGTNNNFVAGWGLSFLNNNALPHNVQNNTILATPNPSAFGSTGYVNWNIWCGIHTAASNNIRYCTNTIQGCFQALHKLGSNATADAVFANSFLSNWRGISADNPADYGQQMCTANTFLPVLNGTAFYNDAAYNGNSNVFNSPTDRFFVNPTISAQNPTPTSAPWWFVGNNNCINQPAPACPTIFGIINTGDTEYRIATGQLFPVTDQTYDGWNGRYKLYSTIKAYPDQYSGSIYTQFVSQFENTGIGKLYNVETLIHEGMIYSPSLRALKLEYDRLIDSLLNLTVALDEQINSTSNVNVSLILDKSRKINSIDSLRLLRGALKNMKISNNLSIINDALNVLNSWTTNTVYETNEKLVRQYYLKQIKNLDDLTTGAIDTLLGIALSCPFEDGQAVYFARAILKSNNYNFVYDYPDHECVEQRQTNKSILVGSKIKIYPNPAHSSLRLEGDEEILSVEIFDTKGAFVYHETSSNIKSINLAELANGLYVMRIFTKSGKTELHKIIKQ